jgi:hypothetical protein
VTVARLSDLFSPPNFSANGWADIVLLAHKYIMDDIGAGSIKQLKASKPPLNAIEMIKVAMTVDAKDLYRGAVNDLGGRDDMITLEDAHKIGIEAFHEIYFLQLSRKDERVHKRPRVSKQAIDSTETDRFMAYLLAKEPSKKRL